jgi:hypothetical protein
MARNAPARYAVRPMNTQPSSRFSLRSAALLAAFAAVGSVSAFAGAGARHWQAQPPAASLPGTPCVACAEGGAVTVAPAWPNGRGPLAARPASTAAHSCQRDLVVMKPTWHNGRGPLAPVSVRATEPRVATQPIPGRG